jgi:hypothetical protein
MNARYARCAAALAVFAAGAAAGEIPALTAEPAPASAAQ